MHGSWSGACIDFKVISVCGVEETSGTSIGADLEAGTSQPLTQLLVTLDDAAQLAADQVPRQNLPRGILQCIRWCRNFLGPTKQQLAHQSHALTNACVSPLVGRPLQYST